MQKSKKNSKSVYLSSRKSESRTLFYAVFNLWNPEKNAQDKKQVYLGSLNRGVYHFNAKALDHSDLFMGTPHELSYLSWRQEQYLSNGTSKAREPVEIKRAGVSLLLNHIADEISLNSTLEAVFGLENAQKILSLAYFSLSFPQDPLSLITAWSVDRKLPWSETITTETIHQLFGEMDPIAINLFLDKWLQTSPRENRLPFTISPRTSFSKDCVDIMYDTQSETSFSNFRMLVIVDQKSLIPLWFRQLPKTNSEIETVSETVSMIEQLDGTPSRMVFDRNFASAETIDWLCEHGIKFTMDVPLWKFPAIREQIRQAKAAQAFTLPENTLEPFQGFEWLPTQAVSHFKQQKGHRVHTHIYYTHFFKEQANDLLRENIFRIKQALEKGKKISAEDQELAAVCIKEQEIPGFGKNYVLNNAGLKKLMDDETGFYSIVTSQFKDPFEALIACELRYAIENFFNNLKNEEDCHRLSVYSGHNFQARLFIQFISQILRSRLRYHMNKRTGKFAWGHTVTGVLWDVDSLQQVTSENGSILYKKPSDLQRDIFKFFDIPISSVD